MDFPSFENHCFADPNLAGSTLLLGDQATYCLFGGCQLCPRFQDARRFSRPDAVPFAPIGFAPLPSLISPKIPGSEVIDYDILDAEPLDPDLRAVEVDRADQAFDLIDFAVDSDEGFDDDFDDDEFGGRRVSPAWLLAGTLFLGTFLCSSVMFFFVSFQAVRGNLGGFFTGSPAQGQVYAVAPAQQNVSLGQAAVEQSSDSNASDPNTSVVLVVTATPVSSEDDSGGDNAEAQNENTAELNAPDTVASAGSAVELDAVTTESVDEAAPEQDEVALIAPSPTVINFPQAVTPTPIVVQLDNLDGGSANGNAEGIVRAADVSPPDEGNAGPRFIPAPSSTPVPEINVNVLVPTPPDGPPDAAAGDEPLIEQVNEIASQPVDDADQGEDEEKNEDEQENEEEPTSTPTPTATWPPPVVLFGAKDKALMANECTEIFWTVENVRAVYVENIPMNGSGDREECIRDKGETFVLTVVLPDGGTEIYTTTVELLLPTATPTPTPTFTPVPIPTATWTPIPPSPTPTPAFVYGVSLSAAGQNMTCNTGAACELGITVQNIGNTTDNIAVYVERGGEWLPTLCSAVGNCSVDRLVIAGVGEGNTSTLTLKFDIPADSPPRTESYIFRAASEGSNGTAVSDSITIEVNVP